MRTPEIKIVDHALRYPIPVDTDAPPAPIVIDHSGDKGETTGEAIKAGVSAFDETSDFTKIALLLVAMLIFGAAVLGAAVWFVLKRTKPVSRTGVEPGVTG
jgi:hypothetical protein